MLFVDDQRPRPSDLYLHAETASEARFYFEFEYPFDIVSLDYDLGSGQETCLDLLKWMRENDKTVPHINIHSDHSLGREEMRRFIQENFPDTHITMNPAKN